MQAMQHEREKVQRVWETSSPLCGLGCLVGGQGRVADGQISLVGSWCAAGTPRTDACAARMPRRLHHRDVAPPRIGLSSCSCADGTKELASCVGCGGELGEWASCAGVVVERMRAGVGD